MWMRCVSRRRLDIVTLAIRVDHATSQDAHSKTTASDPHVMMVIITYMASDTHVVVINTIR